MPHLTRLLFISVFLQSFIIACDNRHRAIQEYDCHSNGNGCPDGFACEFNGEGRSLCVDRRGNVTGFRSHQNRNRNSPG